MSRVPSIKRFLSSEPEARQAGGRSREANDNDAIILEAAREVFVANPLAPISDVAARAGVGIAALYRRYPSKEHLLAKLCADGQHVYIEETEAALAEAGPLWEAYQRFLRRIVARNTHALSSRLAGTFHPTEVHAELGERLRNVGEQLFKRVKASGEMRTDVTLLDVGFLLEGIAQVQLGDAQRTAEQRQRLVSLLLDSLRAGAATRLPGKAPTWEEYGAKWIANQG